MKLAEAGESISAGTVDLAPPHEHLIVRRGGSLALVNGRKIRHVRSSANPLFASRSCSPAATVTPPMAFRAQDKASSVVFGMAQSAIQTGAVHAILPLAAIAPELLRLAKVPA